MTETVEQEWTLTVRVSALGQRRHPEVDGAPVDEHPADGWWRVTRRWRLGEGSCSPCLVGPG